MVKYTFNFTDKSILTSLSLYFNSGLLFTVLILFSYSACLLCVMSSVILLCFCYVHHVALLLFSFCTVPSLYTISLLFFIFLLFSHFYIQNDQLNSVTFIFFYSPCYDGFTSPSTGRINDICLGN
jgi:hypothetical protein